MHQENSEVDKIKVFGIGAIGSNLLVQLVKQFPDLQFEAYDYDKVEGRNIGPQAYFIEHVGLPKTKALHVVLKRFNRKPNIVMHNEKIGKPIADPKDSELFIDCFDNVESRSLFSMYKDTNVLHLGFSPEYCASYEWNKNYTVGNNISPNALDICELTDAVGFIHFFVNFATIQISSFITQRRKDNFLITDKTRVRKV